MVVCCVIVGRSLYVTFCFSLLLWCVLRETAGLTSQFWCQEWDHKSFLGSGHTLQTQSRNISVIVTMAAKESDYDSWSLGDLRTEASKRQIAFVSKDGVKTLASKLRVHDRLLSGEDAVEGQEMAPTDLNLEQRLRLQERELEMLELRRKIMQEEREAEREKREHQRQIEKERREAEREAERERDGITKDRKLVRRKRD